MTKTKKNNRFIVFLSAMFITLFSIVLPFIYNDTKSVSAAVVDNFTSLYTEVDYIDSSGGSYIDTLFISSSLNQRVVSTFSVLDKTGWLGLTGSRSSGSQNIGLVFDNNDKFIFFPEGDVNISLDINSIYHVDFSIDNNLFKYLVSLNGIDVNGSYSVSSFNFSNVSRYIFSINNGGVFTDVNGSTRLYSFKLYDNNILVRDYIPVMRNSDYQFGLYDKVDGLFYSNVGVGSFSYDKEVVSNFISSYDGYLNNNFVYSENGDDGASSNIFLRITCNNSDLYNNFYYFDKNNTLFTYNGVVYNAFAFSRLVSSTIEGSASNDIRFYTLGSNTIQVVINFSDYTTNKPDLSLMFKNLSISSIYNGRTYIIAPYSLYNAYITNDVDTYSIYNSAFLLGVSSSGADMYSTGYSNGYTAGAAASADIYYQSGYNDGNIYGYNRGYNAGLDNSGNYNFTNLLSAVIDTPVKYFQSLFNFELLGVNLSGFLTALFTLCVIVTIVKLCIR